LVFAIAFSRMMRLRAMFQRSGVKPLAPVERDLRLAVCIHGHVSAVLTWGTSARVDAAADRFIKFINGLHFGGLIFVKEFFGNFHQVGHQAAAFLRDADGCGDVIPIVVFDVGIPGVQGAFNPARNVIEVAAVKSRPRIG
jgi:hypothetical protein